MRILFLCGYFEKEYEKEVIDQAKKPVEYSANIFQNKMICGLRKTCVNLEVLSAPFIGSFPNASKCIYFKGYEKREISGIRYVSFNNVWGVRNISRANALKKAMESFIQDLDDEKMIVVYSPHTPFIEAARYAKLRDARIRICMVVPDLPQYMNLNKKKSLLYRFGKKYDIMRFNCFNRATDSYMLLTEAMGKIINPNGMPYIVVEGIVTEEDLACGDKRNVDEEPTHPQYIVYAGKLNEKFGANILVDAFSRLQDQNCRLVLCGNGDSVEYIQQASKSDNRILYLGQVSADEAKKWIARANVLVNPRRNDEEYTKYSFPSKNIEYLLSGKPVVGYMLDGMPDCYRDFMILVENNDIETLTKALEKAMNASFDETNVKRYFTEKLMAEKVCKRIISITMK